MYICVCKAVTERQIREAATEGLSSMRELTRALGVGTGCGSCARSAREVLDDELACRASLRAQQDVDSSVA